MARVHTEIAFEAAIEQSLLEKGGYIQGNSTDYNKDFGIDTKQLLPWMLSPPSRATAFALLALAVFGTALAYIVFFQILVQAGASNVMLVTLLIPVTALVLGHVFLNETIQPKEIAGAIVIGIGLLFIDGRLINKVVGHRALPGNGA